MLDLNLSQNLKKDTQILQLIQCKHPKYIMSVKWKNFNWSDFPINS